MASDPVGQEPFEETDDAPEEVEYGLEAPEADTIEQHTGLTADRDESPAGTGTDRASEADLAEQARVVSVDEDDYR